MREREPYQYEEVPAAAILRPLDPTEHNMERLNRIGRGTGLVYLTARVRGPLDRAAFETAVAALTRHAGVRARVVRGPDGLLAFADAAGGPPISWFEVPDPAQAWPRHVEADMNAGPVPTHRGSAFRVFVFTAGDEHAITLAAPHHIWDGISAVALMRELLQQVAQPRALPSLPLRTVESPFLAPCSAQQGERLRQLEREVSAWAPSARDGRDVQLTAALEALEAELLAAADGRVLPAALLDIERLLAQVQRAHPDCQSIAAETHPGPPSERVRRVRTGLLVEVIGADTMTRLGAASRARGVTMHGVLGGALLLAHVARHRALTGPPDGEQLFPIASPVNLRQQFHPPLADDDVRMAVDVAMAVVPIGPGDSFWDVAARFGASVTRTVGRHRTLASWFRTERRSMELPLPGVPVPLISNVGRVAIEPRHGELELLELHACMSTHNMFQIGLLVQTLGGAANVCYYHELPTVSRESMRALARRVRTVLERVAAGDTPSVAEV